MIIKWFGQTAIQIKSKNKIVVIDPASKKTGLEMPKLRADILALTEDSKDIDKKVVNSRKKKELFIIDGPGEYEVSGVMAKGIRTKNNNTIYTFYSENISVAHLGRIKQKELNQEQLEELNNVDILLIPTGNKGSVDGEEAVDLTQQIEPKIVIPIYYQIEKQKKELDKVDKFLKNEGVKNIEPVDELKIKKSKLKNDEETEVVVLNPN